MEADGGENSDDAVEEKDDHLANPDTFTTGIAEGATTKSVDKRLESLGNNEGGDPVDRHSSATHGASVLRGKELRAHQHC